MQRRTLLKVLPALGISAVWISACKNVDEPKIDLKNLKLRSGDYTLVASLLSSILPSKDATEQGLVNEFAFKYIDQVTTKIDRDAFSDGLKEIKALLKSKAGKNIDQIDTESVGLVWKELLDAKNPASKTLELLKNAAVTRYTSREQFMTDKLSYKFVPGVYQGCVKI
jgi:hypothetical protein